MGKIKEIDNNNLIKNKSEVSWVYRDAAVIEKINNQY